MKLKTDLSKMPMLQIPIDSIKNMGLILTTEEIGEIMLKAVECVETGECEDFKDRAVQGLFNTLMTAIENRGNAWLRKTKNFRESNPKKRGEDYEETPF